MNSILNRNENQLNIDKSTCKHREEERQTNTADRRKLKYKRELLTIHVLSRPCRMGNARKKNLEHKRKNYRDSKQYYARSKVRRTLFKENKQSNRKMIVVNSTVQYLPNDSQLFQQVTNQTKTEKDINIYVLTIAPDT